MVRRRKKFEHVPASQTDLNSLIKNAKNVWFVLLGVFSFVGITLMDVSDVDFYGVNRSVQLPLVGTTVPTRVFFVASPIILAACYCYFHIYLSLIAHALSSQERSSQKLSREPWLVMEAMNSTRSGPEERRSRLMQFSAWLNIAIAWGFGLVVLSFLWVESMTSRSISLSLTPLLCLTISLWVGVKSYLAFPRAVKQRPILSKQERFISSPSLLILFAFLCSSFVTVERAHGWMELFHSRTSKFDETQKKLVRVPRLQNYASDLLSTDTRYVSPNSFPLSLLSLHQIDLSGQSISSDMNGLLESYSNSKDSFGRDWCGSFSEPNCYAEDPGRLNEFYLDWRAFRMERLRSVVAPNLAHVDFRDANLSGAIFVGSNLFKADFSGANLERATLERTILDEARFVDATINETILAFSSARKASFDDAEIRRSNLEFVDFKDAYFNFSILDKIVTYDTDFNANLADANFLSTDFSHANLLDFQAHGMRIQSSFLSMDNLLGLSGSQLTVDYSMVLGDDTGRFEPIDWRRDFSRFVLTGVAFKNANFANTDFDHKPDLSTSFFDSSVTTPHSWERPCQTITAKLGFDEFLVEWMAWAETGENEIMSWSMNRFGPPILKGVDTSGVVPNCSWPEDSEADAN